jgi:hypothetical protein
MRCFAPLARSAVLVLGVASLATPVHAQARGGRGGIVDETVSFEEACEKVRGSGAFRRVDVEVRSRFEAMPTSAALQSCFLRDAKSPLEVVVSSARAGGGGDALVVSLRATNNGLPLVDKREVLSGPGGGAQAVQMLARSLSLLAVEMGRLPGAPNPERCARLKANKATVILLISERAVENNAAIPHTLMMAGQLSDALITRCVQVVDGLGGVPLGDLVRDHGPYAVRGEVLIRESGSDKGVFHDKGGVMRSYGVQLALDLVSLDSETRLGSVQEAAQVLGISPANAIKAGRDRTNKVVELVADQLAVKLDDRLRGQ